jgi:REP element-mobilizing transposase RayT
MERELPVRKKIRLEGYDYSSNGAYFLTFCVKDGHSMLCSIDVGANSVRPLLSDIGKTVEYAITQIPIRYPMITVDKYVIMQNHIHIILIIRSDDDGRTLFAPTISRVIKQFKGFITKQIGFSLWHTSFHDRIIRDKEEYEQKWRYIDNNPVNWAEDEFYFERGV